MRRRKSMTDSLEMFLDTICNTFGGILFILLFVVLQLKMVQNSASDAEPSYVSSVEYAAVESHWHDLRQRLESLQSESEQYAEMSDLLFDRETKELFGQWRDHTETNRRLIGEITDQAERVAKLDAQTALNRENAEELQNQVRILRDKLRSQAVHLKEIKAANTQNISLPQMRTSYKSEIGVVLRFGRLYLPHQYSHDGIKTGYNLDDFTILEETSSSFSVVPNPWRGIDLKGEETETKMERLFAPFQPSLHKMVLIVSPDTFGQYGVVRDYLKKRSYDIRPITFGPDDSIADRGGSNSEAQ